MRVVANLSTMFQNVELIKRYEKAAKLGFRFVEISLPYEVKAEELKREADRHSLKHILINAPAGDWSSGFRGIAALPSCQSDFPDSITTAIEYANILECKKFNQCLVAVNNPLTFIPIQGQVHIMAGVTEINDESMTTYMENIAYACGALAEHGIMCLIEPINQITIPNYFLGSYAQAVEILQRIGHPNLRITLDIFHAQQICGKLTNTITTLSNFIGHVQVAQVPGRNEPNSNGEINYQYVFEILKRYGIWDIGCEYSESSELAESVEWVHLINGIDKCLLSFMNPTPSHDHLDWMN
ncbi:unnamed protein product [Dracunculus medinensis]|uniref:Putative hydroxypyruvate isomerase n=1 Tax=Dracunculus medinensis TaxID=318479 RepID=A0A158Q6C0_DRAME|nr:unnamed protein product [Dracunculus medinensis]